MTKSGLVNKSNQVSGSAVPNGAETILCQVQVNTDNPGAAVILEGNVDITTGAATTALTLQIRRGATTAGPVVAVAEQPAEGAAVRVVSPLQVIDNPGEVASQIYSLTVTPVGATGAGVCNSASLQATY